MADYTRTGLNISCNRNPNLYGGKQETGERLQLSVKHGGGSARVWGCGDLVETDEIMNAEKCIQILIKHVILSEKLPRTLTSTLLKQCGIILAENGTEGDYCCELELYQ